MHTFRKAKYCRRKSRCCNCITNRVTPCKCCKI